MSESDAQISVYLSRPGAQPPTRATDGAAGWDVVAALQAPILLGPGERDMVPTGLVLAIPAGFEVQVRPRSGLAARHGVTVLNSPGTIDSDYRGEVRVLLVNHGTEPFKVAPGERIAQLVCAKVAPCTWHEVASPRDLGKTERGDAGFGSTGRR